MYFKSKQGILFREQERRRMVILGTDPIQDMTMISSSLQMIVPSNLYDIYINDMSNSTTSFG